MSLHIDRRDGLVKLPNGFVISAHLSQDEFRASEWFAATVRDVGTRPFVHYYFSCGEVEGRGLVANLSFYDQMLLSIDLQADLSRPGPKDWSNYSLEVEAATKRFHEDLLRKILGEPGSDGTMHSSQRSPSQATLDRPCSWKFSWGQVSSFHDQQGGGTFIMISYGNRNEEANRAYRSRKVGAA
ncbi:MAG TPA: hypothetical protein VGP99_05365 [Tepidisphaeraceae bacterium]|nr:hypothetical protein [Tepidisphaeraceae bacterium]